MFTRSMDAAVMSELESGEAEVVGVGEAGAAGPRGSRPCREATQASEAAGKRGD